MSRLELQQFAGVGPPVRGDGGHAPEPDTNGSGPAGDAEPPPAGLSAAEPPAGLLAAEPPAAGLSAAERVGELLTAGLDRINGRFGDRWAS